MFRSYILVVAASLMWSGTALWADTADSRAKLHFVRCLDTISADHCVASLCRRFRAVHGNDSDEGVYYRLVSGPGYIDEETGMWCCEPQRDSVVPGREYWVEVEASLGKGGHQRTVCRSPFELRNRPPVPSPEHEGYNRYVSVRALDTLVMSFTYVDPDRCDRISYLIDSVVPSTFARKSYKGNFFFIPSRSDTNKTFRFVLGATDGYDTVRCALTVRVEPGDPDTALFSMRIPVIRNVYPGSMIQVPLYLDTARREIGGFEFLIGFDSRILFFNATSPGEDLYDTSGCGWEYFTYRYVWGGSPGPPPFTDRVRLIGIAETNNGPDHHPRCLLPDTYPVTVARMQFLVTNDRNFECAFTPVSFLWESCSDNVLQSPTGQTAYHSLNVFDVSGKYIGPSAYPPTLTGVTDSCIDYAAYRRQSIPAINFRNGGVESECWEVDGTGDINLNGLSFELADYVMFRNYFLYGALAFAGHVAGSTAASDVNKDGRTLTLEDYIVLYRTVFGLTPIGSGASVNTAVVGYDPVGGEVALFTPDTLGAVLFTFKGTEPVTVTGPAELLSWGSHDSVTSVFLSPVIFSGTSIRIEPPLPLLSAAACTYDGRSVETIISPMSDVDDGNTSEMPMSFALHQNYPNPFNLATTISFDLPTPCNVRVEIVNTLGQVVCAVEGAYPVGSHRIVWNGTSSDGKTVSSGVYYSRLTAGRFAAVRKMVLLK